MKSNNIGFPAGAWHVIVAVLLTACGASPPPKAARTASALTTTNAEATTVAGASSACEVVCEGAKIVAQPGESPDYHAQAIANADRVFATMHGDLLACYKERVAVDSNAHAFLTVDVVIGPDGRVQSVETTGGARLGNKAMVCIANRIRAATFEPIPGGGTRRIQVPLTLRRLGAGESI